MTDVARPAIGSGPRTMASIIRDAAALTGIPEGQLLGESRSQPDAGIRGACAWVARRAHGFSLARIGKGLGDRDHSTIAAAIIRADERRRHDPEYLRLSEQLLLHALVRQQAATRQEGEL